MIPPVTENPFAGLGFFYTLSHAAQTFFLGLCFAIDLAKKKRVMLNVEMGICQPRQNGLALHILLFHLAVREAFQLILIPHSDDPSACDQNRRSLWMISIKRVNICVVEEFHNIHL